MKVNKIEFEVEVRGEKLTFNLPAPEHPRSEPSVFVVGAHKTGSTLLNNLIKDLAKSAGEVDIPVELLAWRQGVPTASWPESLYEFLDQDGFIFTGFRSLHRIPSLGSFKRGKKIFLIRDPRDLLVSYYFSIAKSHGVPKSGATRESSLKNRAEVSEMTLDEFILADKGGIAVRNMQAFVDLIDENTHLFKYEDVIYEKMAWAQDLSKILGFDVDAEELIKIVEKHDVFPEAEDESKHIRQVHPGNYKTRLSQESVEFIESRYAGFMKKFGYI